MFETDVKLNVQDFDLKSSWIFPRVYVFAFICLSCIYVSRSRCEIHVLIDSQGHPLFSPKFLGKSCQWSLYSEGKYPLYNHPVFHVALRHNYSVSQPVNGEPSVCSYTFYIFLTVHPCIIL